MSPSMVSCHLFHTPSLDTAPSSLPPCSHVYKQLLGPHTALSTINTALCRPYPPAAQNLLWAGRQPSAMQHEHWHIPAAMHTQSYTCLCPCEPSLHEPKFHSKRWGDCEKWRPPREVHSKTKQTDKFTTFSGKRGMWQMVQLNSK